MGFSGSLRAEQPCMAPRRGWDTSQCKVLASLARKREPESRKDLVLHHIQASGAVLLRWILRFVSPTRFRDAMLVPPKRVGYHRTPMLGVRRYMLSTTLKLLNHKHW